MMARPFYFGRPRRALFGVLHEATTANRGALLICAPLLQEGIRTQRALWLLAEALATAGLDVLRFDWYGSGNSGGTGQELDFAGMLDDLQMARSALQAAARTPCPRLLAMRSAALPLLAHAAAGGASDLVLWDPQLVGSDLVATWRAQHLAQLYQAGRYPDGNARAEPDEILGFDVAPELLDALSGIDTRELRLPAGSRLLQAAWEPTADARQFADHQTAHSVSVRTLALDASEQPSWDDMHRFENLVLPRRGVAQLAQCLIADAG